MLIPITWATLSLSVVLLVSSMRKLSLSLFHSHSLSVSFESTAKAVHDNKLLECYFTRSFYKHILGKQVKHTDMESQDYEFYKGLDYLMKNDISTLGYELTFSTEVQEFGVTQIRDLKPNGRDVAVTEENKFEYVQLVCQLKMSGSIRQQWVANYIYIPLTIYILDQQQSWY